MSRMPPQRVGRVMEVMGPFLRKTMLQRYRLDSCIAASRIGMDFLAGLGIPSEAVRVEAMFFSADMVNRFRREGRMPNSVEERERWVAETGGHSVGLGVTLPDGSPGLHVVLLVDGAHLWDLSADQADRPAHGLRVPDPMVGPVDVRAFKRGTPLTAQSHDGAVAVYRISKDRYEQWRQSNNWRKDGRDAADRAALVQALLRGLGDAISDTAIPRPTPTGEPTHDQPGAPAGP